MRVKFWGVRGSIPCPGPQTAKYGGNTACLELRFPGSNRLVIIDAGSGIRELGNYIMAHDLPQGPITTSLYLSHTHWDHIMGLPFFTPSYLPSTTIRVFGPINHEDPLEAIVGGQMTYRYFPVTKTELAATFSYTDLAEGCLDLGDGVRLCTKRLNHPIPCFGYRFECQGKVFCTAYDNEPYTNLFHLDPSDPSYDPLLDAEGELVAAEQNAAFEHFIEGADLLIYDAQYTRQEYEVGKRGWGHSAIEQAIEVARRNGVKRLALFHHDPMRTDAQLDALSEQYGQASGGDGPEIFFAREGMEIVV